MWNKYRIALNASTIRGYNLPIVEQVKVAAEAGYDGIEPWLRDIDAFLASGGDLDDLARQIADRGLQLAGAIAFWRWADKDPQVRRDALALAERELALVARLGGTAVAAPPFGDVGGVPLDEIASCYASLWDLASGFGIVPYLELWGHASRLSTVAEVLHVAAASRRPAKLLLDVYHLYKGGNSIGSLSLISGNALGLLHVNDYPASPSREVIGDADRVWPGDGIAPIPRLVDILAEIGFTGMLSVELFNPGYWTSTPLETAREGLNKTRQAFCFREQA